MSISIASGGITFEFASHCRFNVVLVTSRILKSSRFIDLAFKSSDRVIKCLVISNDCLRHPLFTSLSLSFDFFHNGHSTARPDTGGARSDHFFHITIGLNASRGFNT